MLGGHWVPWGGVVLGFWGILRGSPGSHWVPRGVREGGIGVLGGIKGVPRSVRRVPRESLGSQGGPDRGYLGSGV